MGFTSHLLLCVLCVAWVLPMMTMSSDCDQTLHYDKGKLYKYIFIFQQLRGEMERLRSQIEDTTDTLDADIDAAEAALSTDLNDAIDITEDSMARVVNVTSYMKMNLAPALNVWSTHTYSDSTAPIFTDVKLTQGIKYDSSTAEATVPIKGVYQVEYKLQADSYRFFSADITVYGPNGNTLYDTSDRWVYGCSLAMRMFNLEAGSVIKMSNMKPYNSYYQTSNPAHLKGGFHSQLTIRYFGPGV